MPGMATGGAVPVFDNIINQELLPHNLFAFYLPPVGSHNEEGQLLLGGVNHDYYTGDIYYHQNIDDCYWLVNVTQIRIGDVILSDCPNGCRTLVDTGTSLLTAPSDFIDFFVSKFSEKEKV